MTLPPGTRLGPHEIVEQLGAGGMGVVYRARDARLQRDVAVKLLPFGVLSDESSRARFHREALALGALSHPNIATLYDVGDQDGLSYIVMECVPGRSLASMIEAGPLPVGDVVSLGSEIAAALQEAHDHGIVHRDLKPANVMVTPKGHAKVLDFGLAKLLAPSGAPEMSETRGAVGTLLYMSPEQATADALDGRTDVWSLGVVLYEALTGAPPFRAAGTYAVMRAITEEQPAPVRARRPDVPAELEAIVMRALAKDPAARFQTAAELERALSVERTKLSGPLSAAVGIRPRLTTIAAIAAVVVLLVAVGGWSWYRADRRRWAREQALPMAAKLRDGDRPLAAWLLLQRAHAYAPADSQIGALLATDLDTLAINSSPSGATVEVQDYVAGDSAWHPLGTTPIAAATIPDGYYRWRISAPGIGTVLRAPMLRGRMRFALDSSHAAPPGMVYAEGGHWADFIAFLGWVGPYAIPGFYLGRYEVTNREYQRFVDAGGYASPVYWQEPFVADGKPLRWDEAMALLRDSTGRPGPSTWKGGHYADGEGDFPVGGVSWYEAAAYAAWTHQSLPTMAQWYYAAPPDAAAFTVQASNISRERVARAGAFDGVGPFGSYDMAGNVREWVANPLAGGRRLILGGAWSSESYLFSEPEALSPFDRAAGNGLRVVRNIAPVPPAMLAEIQPRERDFSKFEPASDEVFRAYEALYAYRKTPLDAKSDGVVRETPDWREERVTYRAAYGDERMPAYLFLPKHVKPPYQTVVFFPSARVLALHDSRELGDTSFFDFVVQSGRAVLYPIYQGTYERRVRVQLPGASQDFALTQRHYWDLARSLDYLATRPDLDTTKLAYLGVSMGAAEGVIFGTLEQKRLKTVLFLDGGYFLDKPVTGGDQADFAPRLKVPLLMVNGRYDFSFSLERAQSPLFAMLGTPAADKKHVVLDTPHDVRAKRPEMIGAVLPWLDRYLGPVR